MPNQSTHHPSHPPSLKVFFATEVWERYGFYVVQTLLALYLAMYFKWEDKQIYPLVGSFTALTYLSPLIGGWIADHLLGQKRTILLGTLVLSLSYLALGLIISDTSLSICLAGIAVGTGLLKPNISSLLGNEYPIGSESRERGFTIFYMGITTGIILGTTLPSYLQAYFGWHTAFLSSSFGMVIAALTFSFGVRHYRISDYSEYDYQFKNVIISFALILLLWLGSYFILHTPALADALFICIGIFSVLYLLLTMRQENETQRRQTLVISLLCLISVVFWSFYFQMFLSLTLFLKRVAEPTLLGIPFPPPYYVAVQSLGIIVIGFFLGRNRRGQSTLAQHSIKVGNKFLYAMLSMVLAYTLISIVCFASAPGMLPVWYFIPAYLMISLAELLLSPVGLSAITMLSNYKKVSTMMGIFFVSLGLGGYLSGKLAILTAVSQEDLNRLPLNELKLHYGQTFSELLLILLAATFLCVLLNRVIRYLMQDRN